MREILFRGKKIDNGDWAYGFYNESILKEKKYFIMADLLTKEFVQVIPETIGQFTGLTDKNGVKIFEGDVLDINQTVNGISEFVVLSCIGGYDVRYFYDGKPQREYEYSIYELLDIGVYDKEIEIIGNIHEINQ